MKHRPPPRVRLYVYISPALHKRLRTAAAADDRPVSEYARRILEGISAPLDAPENPF